jgi:cytochrome c biogenesis protein CcmG, thiol:disulfide interchange protein DsbE
MFSSSFRAGMIALIDAALDAARRALSGAGAGAMCAPSADLIRGTATDPRAAWRTPRWDRAFREMYIIRCGGQRLKNRILSGAVLLGVLLLVFVFASPSYRQGEAGVAGKAAPEFSFTLDGKPATLADLRGKIVVLNFWATWCPPCLEETPSLNHLQSQIAALGGVVLGISVDDNQAAYEKFLRDQHVIFPTFRDTSASINVRYGTTVFPETYIIGRDGRMLRKIIGPQDWDSDELLGYLRSLLAQAR